MLSKYLFILLGLFAIISACSTDLTELEEGKTTYSSLDVVPNSSWSESLDSIAGKQTLQTILTYIQKNYPGAQIIELEKYPEGYEATLNNGVKLEFDIRGNFIEVSGSSDSRDLDPKDLPESILLWVEKNYVTASIVKAEKKDGGFEIELNNGIKVLFDSQGKMLRIDD